MASAFDKVTRKMEVGKFFTPTTPVDEASLFSGRSAQIERVSQVISQKGQHVIIFGERGVGKTSLANVLSKFLAGGINVMAARATADANDNFSSIWRKVFSEIQVKTEKDNIGFTMEKTILQQTLADHLPQELTPDLVRRVLQQLSGNGLVITIIDEFDRVGPAVATAIADTIKMLSDHAVRATVVLVGVADSVDQLIKEHASVERALVQVPMPRMSGDEIREIINRGMTGLKLSINNDALERIVLLAQGLPHYAHLLGLHASNAAIDDNATTVETNHVNAAMSRAVEDAQSSIQAAYMKATASPRSENLYSEVLLACALARPDELGYFTPASVRNPMSTLMGRRYDIPSYSRHLYDFAEDDRGPILERTGTERKFRYRFKNPLLQPYIIMRGLSEGLLDDTKLKEISQSAE